jgi:hypothetical protein
MNSKLESILRKLTGRPDPKAADRQVGLPAKQRRWEAPPSESTKVARTVHGPKLFVTDEILREVIASDPSTITEAERAALLEADATIARLTALESDIRREMFGTHDRPSAYQRQAVEAAKLAGSDEPEKLRQFGAKTREELTNEFTVKKEGIRREMRAIGTEVNRVVLGIVPRIRVSATRLAEAEESKDRAQAARRGLAYEHGRAMLALRQLAETSLVGMVPPAGAAVGSLRNNPLVAALLDAKPAGATGAKGGK